MKRFILFLNVCICALALNAQETMVCNFDNVLPAMSNDANLNCQIVPAPAGSLASGNMVSISNINGNNTGSNWVALELDFTFDLRDYAGLSLLVQIPNGVHVQPNFALKLEQSTMVNAGDYAPGRIQAWDIYKKYTGEGEWQEVQIPFDILKTNLQAVLDKTPDFPTKFDRIVLVLFSYYSGGAGSTFTMNIDDVKLCKSWASEPEPGGTNVLVCDFDGILPYVDYTGNILYDVGDAPAGSPASGQIGVFDIPANNEGDNIAIYLNNTFDPRKYVGISFLAQIPEGVSPDFAIKLEQSTASGNRIQTFSNYDKYTGNGQWQEVHIRFDKLLSKTPGDNDDLAYRLAQNSNFPADKYDVIVIVPGAYNNLSAFRLNIDDITLRTNWDDKTEVKSVLLANFDNVLPYDMTFGGLTGTYDKNPVGSENLLTINNPGGNTPNNWFTIWTDFKFDPRDYVGISFKAKVPETTIAKLRFGFRMQQSTDGSNANALQNITNYEEYNAGEYTGAGEWQEVHLTFAQMTLKDFASANRGEGKPYRTTGNVTNIWDKIAANANYPADQFDKISVALHPYIQIAPHTLLVDDIYLRASWDDNVGIPLLKKDAGINIFAVNGVINAKAIDGKSVALNVYTLSGQKITSGLDQVQVGTKGIFIVKATSGNVSKVSKIIVR